MLAHQGHGYGTPYYNSHTGAYGYSNTTYGAYGKTTTARSTIPIPARMHEALPPPQPTVVRVSAKPKIPIPGHMARLTKAQVQRPSGDNPTCNRAIKLPIRSTTPRPTVRSPAPKARKEAARLCHVFCIRQYLRGQECQRGYVCWPRRQRLPEHRLRLAKYDNGSWNNVNTQQAQQEAQQKSQSYQQQHPDSQSNRQHEQSFNQDRSSGSFDSQTMNSDMQNRMSGASQSDHFDQSRSSGGWGRGGGDRSWGGGGWRR